MKDGRQEMNGQKGSFYGTGRGGNRQRDGQRERNLKENRAELDGQRDNGISESGAEFTGGEKGLVSEQLIEGRNVILEASRSRKAIDKLFVLDRCKDGPIQSIMREAGKYDTIINYTTKERLGQLSEAGKHQGAIAMVAAYEHAEMENILSAAKEKEEPPFVLLLDGVEDPRNLGATIHTANLADIHGMIVPKWWVVGLTATMAGTSAGALNYTPVAKTTNLVAVIEDLKKEGLWFVCIGMGGELMYRMNLTGPTGLVTGNEGNGVGKPVQEKCDMIASTPIKGDTNSLNTSVTAGVLVCRTMRQRLGAEW